MKKLILLIALMFVVACKIRQPKEDVTTSEKPNILLIVVDDQGYADFEPFNNKSADISTPNMSRIADAGMVFTQAYTTAPVCSMRNQSKKSWKLEDRNEKN